jgi:hypothetical protein
MDAMFCSLLLLLLLLLFTNAMQVEGVPEMDQNKCEERKQSNLTNDSGQREILATKQLLR